MDGRARPPVRLYTDFVRGTPVLVLVLASYYMLSDHRPQPRAVSGGRPRARRLLLLPCRRNRAAARCRRSPRARPRPPRRSASPSARPFVMSSLPQAIRQILPAWVNTAAEMVKASTLLSVDRRRRTAPAHAGDHLPQLHEPGVLFPCRRPLLRRQLQHRALRQVCRAPTSCIRVRPRPMAQTILEISRPAQELRPHRGPQGRRLQRAAPAR